MKQKRRKQYYSFFKIAIEEEIPFSINYYLFCFFHEYFEEIFHQISTFIFIWQKYSKLICEYICVQKFH